ncbi:MAG: HDOD domain-containing protein [Rhodocyclaceae bacterium]|nr:HDOD domain-containing protein [Rhodocyclaceae bacterium]
MLTDYQRHWGVDQWAAYLTAQELPSMLRSKMLMAALEETKGDALSAKELAGIASSDPFLCLRLLRAAEQRRSRRLGRDTTTPLGAVMQLGVTTFRDMLSSSPETDTDSLGLAACESRAVLASQLAVLWVSARSDIAPDEVALATLLSETGELLLWSFAPELPQAAEDALAAGLAARSAQAQQMACGFRFKDLTLKCATIWELPLLLTHLIQGVDNVRANICRLCVDTARHLATGPDNPALPSDLAEAKRLIPQASLQWLATNLIGLDDEQRAATILKAEAILKTSVDETLPSE